jgi:hypothetical protein
MANKTTEESSSQYGTSVDEKAAGSFSLPISSPVILWWRRNLGSTAYPTAESPQNTIGNTPENPTQTDGTKDTAQTEGTDGDGEQYPKGIRLVLITVRICAAVQTRRALS